MATNDALQEQFREDLAQMTSRLVDERKLELEDYLFDAHVTAQRRGAVSPHAATGTNGVLDRHDLAVREYTGGLRRAGAWHKSPESRELWNRVADRMNELQVELSQSRLTRDAANAVRENYVRWGRPLQQVDRVLEESRAEMGRQSAEFDRCLKLTVCLNGGGLLDRETARYGKKQFGVDLADRGVLERMTERLPTPEHPPFHYETPAFMNPMAFAEKATDLTRPEYGMSLSEDFAVATFRRNFDRYFGATADEAENLDQPIPNTPDYLERFDRLSFDGRSVRDICAETTRGLSNQKAAVRMMCYVTGEMMKGNRQLTLSPGPEAQRQNAAAGPRTVRPRLWNDQPEPNWLQRILAFLGLVDLRSADRTHRAVAEQFPDLAQTTGQRRRDLIQRSLLEQRQAENERLPGDDRDFYHPDDLRELNPGCPVGKAGPRYFDSDQMGGAVRSMHRDSSRVSLARLYMLSKGHSMDQVYSNAPEDRQTKRALGKELYGILHSGNPEKIAGAYADMARCLSNTPYPRLDYQNDAELVARYRDLSTLRLACVDFSQTIGLRPEEKGARDRNPVEQALFDKLGEREYDRLNNSLNTLRGLEQAGLNERLKFIENSDLYSTANRELQKPNDIMSPDEDLGAVLGIRSREGLEMFQARSGHLAGTPMGNTPNSVWAYSPIQDCVPSIRGVEAEAHAFAVGDNPDNPVLGQMAASYDQNGLDLYELYQPTDTRDAERVQSAHDASEERYARHLAAERANMRAPEPAAEPVSLEQLGAENGVAAASKTDAPQRRERDLSAPER